jgi:hypothetical protein
MMSTSLHRTKNRPTKKPAAAPSSATRRSFLAAIDPLLERSGQEAINFAKLLEDVDSATGVETATRQAGFIVGFECCRAAPARRARPRAAQRPGGGEGRCGMKAPQKQAADRSTWRTLPAAELLVTTQELFILRKVGAK